MSFPLQRVGPVLYEGGRELREDMRVPVRVIADEVLLEDIQPSLLRLGAPGTSAESWYRMYRVLSVGTLALILALVVAIPSGVAIGIEWWVEQSFRAGLMHGTIIGVLDGRALTVRAAAELTGTAAADFSRIRHARLDRFTIDRLMTILHRLDQRIEVTVRFPDAA